MRFFKNNKTLLITLLIIIIFLGLSIMLYIINNSQEKKSDESKKEIELVLFGAKEITINQGDKYEEPGFYAIDSDGKIKTNEVIVTPTNLDTTNSGTYYISYVIGNKMEKRKIVILEKQETRILTLTLYGNEEITLKIGEEYIEPGYKASDTVDGDLTNFVNVQGTIDTGKSGTYVITYEIKNTNGDSKTKTRTIIVK